MKTYVLTREQGIPVPLDRLFPFFADAGNLAEITPRWLGFRIKTPLPIQMHTGTRIEYRILLAGWPVKWLTRIEKWNPPHSFVDVQERGPYAYWEHTHEFRADGEATTMLDTVRYRLRLGPIGRAVHRLAVRRALDAIFDYRRDRITFLYGEPSRR